MNYAPILIPTLDRYKHFKRCVETLSKCTGAHQTDLFVALDYPSKPEHFEGYEKISEYLKYINGFREVIIIKRSENYGVAKNLRSARAEMQKVYDTYIYTDDDNEFSPNFLDYINKGLERFRDDSRIIAICGSGGLFKKPEGYQANYLYRKGFSAWGFGTWFDKSYKKDYSVEEMKEFVSDPGLRGLLKYYYERHYYSVLSYIYREQEIKGDGAIALEMIKDDTYCVYPTKSLVRNHGHDGSGVHGGELLDNPFAKIEIDNAEHFDFVGNPVFNDPRYLALLRGYAKVSVWRKTKFWLRIAQNPKKMHMLLKLVIGHKRDNKS